MGANRSSVAPADHKMCRYRGPSTDQEVLWVRFPVAAGSSHTKDVGVVYSCMVLTMKEGPRIITGRPGVSIM